MIPADSITFNDDGTAWVVGTEWWATVIMRDAQDRPCDTCGGSMYVWPEGSSFRSNTPCPDCDGTGRHTFDIEVENDTYLIDPSFTYRVSVVPGMVLPIVDVPENGYPSPKPVRFAYVSKAGALRVVDGIANTDTYTGKPPPDAKPGMSAVLLEVHK